MEILHLQTRTRWRCTLSPRWTAEVQGGRGFRVLAGPWGVQEEGGQGQAGRKACTKVPKIAGKIGGLRHGGLQGAAVHAAAAATA